jgi:hypothetical protein
LGTTPTVETVIRLAPMPSSVFIRRIAATTFL